MYQTHPHPFCATGFIQFLGRAASLHPVWTCGWDRRKKGRGCPTRGHAQELIQPAPQAGLNTNLEASRGP